MKTIVYYFFVSRQDYHFNNDAGWMGEKENPLQCLRDF